MAASSIIIAGPAGAITNDCTETMNPAATGNASGLIVACTFVNAAGAGTALSISDYDHAIWHYGAAREVSVYVSRTASSTAGAGVGTAGKLFKSCATATAAAAGACSGGTAAVGNLALSANDVNHSIEFPTSNTNLTHKFIQAGTFIKSFTSLTDIRLSKATVAGGPLCAGSPGTGNCASSLPTKVLVSNGTNRAVQDGSTTAASNVVTSATANFKPGDVNARLSGGDLPDGAQIDTVDSLTQVTLKCVGCVGGPGIGAFAGVTNEAVANTLVLSIDPEVPNTSTRYITDAARHAASGADAKRLNSASAEFANTDVGLPVKITGVAWARIASVDPLGEFAMLTLPTGVAALPSGTLKATVGVPTKTAPATKDVMGQLAITLVVSPTASPTSPPCDAGKVSGFNIELQWMNPGAYNLATGGSNYQAVVVPATSIAQSMFLTSSTSFAAYVKQAYTTTGGVAGNSDYEFKFEFAPIAVGLCLGTGIAETVNINGISVKQAQNPTNTGGGGGGIRALGPLPEGTDETLVGATGAEVVAGVTPGNDNECNISAPNVVQIGCNP